MRVTLLPLLLLAASSSASMFTSSMEAVTDVAERNYIGGPTAIARAMAAARHVGASEHQQVQAVHAAKMATYSARNAEYVNAKYREFRATLAEKDR